ncbi:tetratricopeptide repeat protein [Halorhodospira halophila]|uniref:tetratricopeptide repeat protein n=1 Tax=Halorhodospira halophila TaxID=1053 RepID=UPI001914291B
MSLINEVLRQTAEREQRGQNGAGDAGVQAAFAVARKPQRRRHWLVAVLAGTVAVAVTGGSAYWLLADRDAGSQQPAPVAAAEDDAVERPDEVTLPDEAPSEAVVGGLLAERQADPEQWVATAEAGSGQATGNGAALEEPLVEPPRADATAVAAAQALAAGAIAQGGAETAPLPEADTADTLEELADEAVAGAEATSPESATEDPPTDIGGAPAEADPASSQGTFVREPSRPDDSARADSLIQQAETHQRAGDTLSASQSYRRALEMDPERHDARIGYARMLARAQRVERARGVLRQGLDRAPAHERMARLYAHLSEEHGEPQAGIDALEPVREARDGRAGAVEAHLAALYRQIGAHDQALLLYSELAEAEPDNGLWQAGIAVSAEALGNDGAARRAWQQARERDGLSAEVAAHAEARIEALQGR